MVLITGAKGFLGKNISLFFHKQGYKVIGIGHGEWSEKEYTKFGISSWVNCHLTLDNLKKYAGKPEIIIHCAGSGSVKDSLSNPLNDFNRSVESLIAILEFIRISHYYIRLIYPSSAAVYGKTNNKSISENDFTIPSSPYGTNKLIGEELCKSYANNFGCSIVIIRFFSLYGPFLKKQLLWDACNKLKKSDFEFYGTGFEIRDWLHVNDACNLIYKAAINKNYNFLIINGSTNIGTSVAEILNKLFLLFEIEGNPIFTTKIREGDPPNFVGDNTLAVNQFDWKSSYLLDQGLLEYCNWFKSLSNG
jgi:UDP-glucose 4-epimerase